ncbi:hypothetical protein DESC_660061 [Desulfosarcina cetonica]|nr:hypothetical protein DESC_660061 [Desulfosarcina cetonica]
MGLTSSRPPFFYRVLLFAFGRRGGIGRMAVKISVNIGKLVGGKGIPLGLATEIREVLFLESARPLGLGLGIRADGRFGRIDLAPRIAGFVDLAVGVFALAVVAHIQGEAGTNGGNQKNQYGYAEQSFFKHDVSFLRIKFKMIKSG